MGGFVCGKLADVLQIEQSRGALDDDEERDGREGGAAIIGKREIQLRREGEGGREREGEREEGRERRKREAKGREKGGKERGREGGGGGGREGGR